ncbi:MAG: nitroreductase family protein [Candidatus Nanohaloarchaea archaeon]
MASLEDITGVKSFSSARDEVIDRKKMGRILEAGRFAPSPGKRQTVEFVVIEDSNTLKHLSSILGDSRIEEAPTSVVILGDPGRMSRTVKNPIEACHAEVSAASQNMRILASSEGLCSNLYTGFDSDAVTELLNAPAEKEAFAVVSFAYSDRPVQPSDRFGMNEICFYDEYGKQVKSVFDGFEWKGVKEESSIYGKKLRGLFSRLKPR